MKYKKKLCERSYKRIMLYLFNILFDNTLYYINKYTEMNDCGIWTVPVFVIAKQNNIQFPYHCIFYSLSLKDF